MKVCRYGMHALIVYTAVFLHYQARMEDARALFRNPETTEFVIVTIPTVMAVAESSRLAETLRSESVPVSSILINQVVYMLVPYSVHCS